MKKLLFLFFSLIHVYGYASHATTVSQELVDIFSRAAEKSCTVETKSSDTDPLNRMLSPLITQEPHKDCRTPIHKKTAQDFHEQRRKSSRPKTDYVDPFYQNLIKSLAKEYSVLTNKLFLHRTGRRSLPVKELYKLKEQLADCNRMYDIAQRCYNITPEMEEYIATPVDKQYLELSEDSFSFSSDQLEQLVCLKRERAEYPPISDIADPLPVVTVHSRVSSGCGMSEHESDETDVFIN